MTDEENSKCVRCGRCCQSVIVPFVAGGEYGEYLIAHGCTILPGRGTIIPSPCIQLKIKRGAGVKDGKPIHPVYECLIYDHRPALCHYDLADHVHFPGCPEDEKNEVE